VKSLLPKRIGLLTCRRTDAHFLPNIAKRYAESNTNTTALEEQERRILQCLGIESNSTKSRIAHSPILQTKRSISGGSDREAELHYTRRFFGETAYLSIRSGKITEPFRKDIKIFRIGAVSHFDTAPEDQMVEQNKSKSWTEYLADLDDPIPKGIQALSRTLR